MKHIVPVTRKSQGAVLPTRLFATAAVLFALAALSACGDSRPTGPTPLPPLPEFDGRFTFVDTMVVDRRERTALVALPASYDHETRIPVLFGYHGGGGSAA